MATSARAATSRICTASYPPSSPRAMAASTTRWRRACWARVKARGTGRLAMRVHPTRRRFLHPDRGVPRPPRAPGRPTSPPGPGRVSPGLRSRPSVHWPAMRTDEDPELIATTDGRVPGRRGRATRQRLLECTAELLVATPWRSIKVIDIAREAGTSPATFYQYFENVEAAITVLAEELVEGAGELAALVDGGSSEGVSWDTSVTVGQGFMDYWDGNRAVFRVVELTTVEGDLRFQGLRVRALNAVTVTLARVIATNGERSGSPAPDGTRRWRRGGDGPHRRGEGGPGPGPIGRGVAPDR